MNSLNIFHDSCESDDYGEYGWLDTLKYEFLKLF